MYRRWIKLGNFGRAIASIGLIVLLALWIGIGFWTRARGYLRHREDDAEPASYAAPVRDFRGVVLAAILLAQRAGEDSADNTTPPGEALLATANALSADLGFEG